MEDIIQIPKSQSVFCTFETLSSPFSSPDGRLMPTVAALTSTKGFVCSSYLSPLERSTLGSNLASAASLRFYALSFLICFSSSVKGIGGLRLAGFAFDFDGVALNGCGFGWEVTS